MQLLHKNHQKNIPKPIKAEPIECQMNECKKFHYNKPKVSPSYGGTSNLSKRMDYSLF